ncbi:hypothetical protein Ancab_020748 [Ancistrocladus abbreviatus]
MELKKNKWLADLFWGLAQSPNVSSSVAGLFGLLYIHKPTSYYRLLVWAEILSLAIHVRIHRDQEGKQYAKVEPEEPKGPKTWPLVGAALEQLMNYDRMHDWLVEYLSKSKSIAVPMPLQLTLTLLILLMSSMSLRPISPIIQR